MKYEYAHDGKIYSTEAEWLAASGPVLMAMDSKPSFDVAQFGKQCAQKALRSHGLAVDSAEETDPEAGEQRWSWCDEDEEDAIQTFGSDWGKFRARRRKAAIKDSAKDTPPDFPGKPETGASDANVFGSEAWADFTRRFPGSERIGHDTTGMPVKQSRAERERTRLARDTGAPNGCPSFDEMFPGAARIKVIP